MGRPSSQLHQFAGATILKVWMHDFTLRNLPEILALGPMDADGKNIHWATGEKMPECPLLADFVAKVVCDFGEQ
jgi:hypothetical protein